MIIVTAYFLVWCYTNTIASCQTIGMLPDAAACAEILAKVKVRRPGARMETCDSYRAYVVTASGSSPTPVCLDQGGPLCAR